MRILGLLGKFLISVGVGVLLFVAWVLWGTGFWTDQQQDRLAEEFANAPVLRAAGSEDALRGPPKGFDPAPGDAVFRMRIPRMELNSIVVEGVRTEDLKLGPGHYPGCDENFHPPLCMELGDVWPGEKGRMVVSGHRTTYDAPFWDLDALKRGDSIFFETKWGDFEYTMTRREIVGANAVHVVNPRATNEREVALTTCNPRFSAAERLVVYAELKEVV